jgi:hypothetical protein
MSPSNNEIYIAVSEQELFPKMNASQVVAELAVYPLVALTPHQQSECRSNRLLLKEDEVEI